MDKSAMSGTSIITFTAPPCFIQPTRPFLPASPATLRSPLKRPRSPSASATRPPIPSSASSQQQPQLPQNAPAPPPPPPPPPPSPSPRFTSITLAITAALAATILTLSPTHCKTLLTDNTIFRRYLIVDSAAILRYALPLPSERTGDPNTAPIRLIQASLEKLGVHLRARGVAGLIAGRRDLDQLQQLLSQRQLDVLLDVPGAKRKEVAALLAQLERDVADMAAQLGDSGPVVGQGFLPPQALRMEQTVRDAFTPRNSIRKITNYDAALVESLRISALNSVSDIEAIAVQDLGLAFRIPRRYNELPRLLGRATVAITIEKQTGSFRDTTGLPTTPTKTFTAILDGYSAPLTAGNFLDLTLRHYYDDTPILSSERNFYTQLGECTTDTYAGFLDTRTNARRTIPLEILTEGERAPTYGATLDDLGIGDLQPVLPVTAFGAMAMVHSVEDVNDASAQFYIFLLDPTSYQARAVGGTALTGSLATFGYVVDGKEYLTQLQKGDIIKAVRVVQGEENFRSSAYK